MIANSAYATTASWTYRCHTTGKTLLQQPAETFDTVISNNPWVIDIFAEQKKHILQPVERIPVRASDIRQAIIDNNIEFLRQYLLPHTLQHLHELDIADRLSKIV